jgi:Zn-finger protein
MAKIEIITEVPDDNCVRPDGSAGCKFSRPRGWWCFCVMFDSAKLEVTQDESGWRAKPCQQCLDARKPKKDSREIENA